MHHERILRVRRRTLGLVVALVAAVGAGVVAAPSGGAASGNQLTITAGEYVYQTKGAPKPGWVTMKFENAGTEYHMLVIVALKPGVTVAQLKQAVTSDDESASDALIDTSVGQDGNILGGPALIGPKSATTTTTSLPAGHYGMLCFIPAASDGQAHAAHGMIKVLDVKNPKSTAKPPTTQAIVTLDDAGIDFPLTNPGRHLSLKVTNAGTTTHSLQFVKLASGKTVQDAKAYFDALFNGQAPAGEPPAELVGGITGLAPGTSGYLEQTLTAGHYAYVSTEGDDPANDDSTRGLLGEFDVK